MDIYAYIHLSINLSIQPIHPSPCLLVTRHIIYLHSTHVALWLASFLTRRARLPNRGCLYMALCVEKHTDIRLSYATLYLQNVSLMIKRCEPAHDSGTADVQMVMALMNIQPGRPEGGPGPNRSLRSYRPPPR
jgi:hypothetical protein